MLSVFILHSNTLYIFLVHLADIMPLPRVLHLLTQYSMGCRGVTNRVSCRTSLSNTCSIGDSLGDGANQKKILSSYNASSAARATNRQTRCNGISLHFLLQEIQQDGMKSFQKVHNVVHFTNIKSSEGCNLRHSTSRNEDFGLCVVGGNTLENRSFDPIILRQKLQFYFLSLRNPTNVGYKTVSMNL